MDTRTVRNGHDEDVQVKNLYIVCMTLRFVFKDSAIECYLQI